jgi:AAA domain
MHAILCGIARDHMVRWTRTQVRYYLPPAFHVIAAKYFEGERVVIPERREVHLVSPETGDLDILLEKILNTGQSESENGERTTRKDPSPLDEFIADMPADELDVIGHVRHALLTEARRVEKESPKRYRLSNGRCVGPEGEHFMYSFTWSSEPDLFVPGELQLGKQIVAARVGRQADGEKRFQLRVDTFLGAAIASAVFKIDPTFLLRTQLQKLTELKDVFESGHPLAHDILEPPAVLRTRLEVPVISGLNERQRNAVAVAVSEKRSYVWGPPGTGKTTTLGYLIRRLVMAGKRVLVLSPYNVAVDQAILAAERRGDWSEGNLVRLGRISTDEVRQKKLDLDSLLELHAERSGVLEMARQLHATVAERYSKYSRPTPATVRACLEDLGEIVIAIGTSNGETKQILKAIKELRQRFRAPELAIVTGARVVATTVTLSMIATIIEAASFDHVLVDEASVLRTPEALLVALAATGKLAFFGDPMQLPPIVLEKSPHADKWLKRNPFKLANVSRPADAKGACVMLNEQHRMAPIICSIVSKSFYEDALMNGNVPADGRVVLLDTSETPARATTRWVRLRQSKENVVHRGIVGACLSAIRKSDQESNILVLSPYLAQKKAYDQEANTNRVRSSRYGTVHANQGTESDIVIIDLVLAPGRGKSRFMNERINPDFRNLMNVALSRAKAQLIVVAHCDYIAGQYPNGLLETLTTMIAELGTKVMIEPDLRVQSTLNDLWANGLS